ncbi:hypothetical protein [Cellulomonas hominis]
MKHGTMQLRFAITTCARCGGTRILCQQCPECGLPAQPHEVQPDLDRRRAVVAAFRSARRSVPHPRIRAERARQQIGRSIHDLQRELARAAKDGRDAAGLVRAFGELDSLVISLEEPCLRPHRNTGRAQGRAARLVRDGFELFVDAICAPTIEGAQALERQGQRLIDSSAVVLRDAHAEAESWDELYERPLQELAGAIGLSARQTAGEGTSLAELDLRLQRLYDHPSGARPGLGLTLHAMRGLLVSALDLEETAALACAAERRFTDASGISGLLDWPSWVSEHNRGIALLSAALFGVARLGDDASDLERIDVLLNVVMKCRESLIPHFIASTAASDGPDYDRLRRKTSGNLIGDGARDYPELHIAEHTDQRWRHAGAHVDFDVHDGQVRIRSGSGGVLLVPVEEVMDAMLSHVELVLAFHIGLSCSAAALGRDLPPSEHASLRDLLIALELAISFVAGTEVSATVEGASLGISFSGEVDRFFPMAAAAAAVLPERIAEVRAEITSADGRPRQCIAPLSAFRDYGDLNADTIGGLLGYATICGQARLDSHSWLTDEEWAALAARVIALSESLSVRDGVRSVRCLRALASRAGASQAAERCTAWIRQLRSGDGAGVEPTQLAPSFATAGWLAPHPVATETKSADVDR